MLILGLLILSASTAQMNNEQVIIAPQMCGLHSVALVVNSLKESDHLTWNELCELLPPDRAPFSLSQIEFAAHKLGFETLALEWPDGVRPSFPCPAILQLFTPAGDSHFITCFGELGGNVVLADFPGPVQIVPFEHLSAKWRGVTLYVSRRDDSRLKVLNLNSETRRSCIAEWTRFITIFLISFLFAVLLGTFYREAQTIGK